jgi:hypothetical protein
MSEICADCRSPYQLTEVEKRSFEALISQRPGFKMPRRCSACRKIRRDQQNARGPMAVPAIPMKGASTRDVEVKITSWEPGVPKIISVEADPTSGPVEAPQKPVSLVLGTGDFEALVAGKPIAWRGVTVVLADIGFKAMYDAIEHAEVERISLAHKRPAAKSS